MAAAAPARAAGAASGAGTNTYKSMAFNPRRQPPSPKKKKRVGGGEGGRAQREGELSALREMFLQPPGAKGWQVSGLGERRAGGRAGTRCAWSGEGGWWSKVAGTAKGGVAGGSGREGGARAGARVCPAGVGGARATSEGKGQLRTSPLGEFGQPAPNARRQSPASRRGAEAGAERAVRKQGLISREAAQPSRRPTRLRAPRRREGRTPPETMRRGTRNRGRPSETPPG